MTAAWAWCPRGPVAGRVGPPAGAVTAERPIDPAAPGIPTDEIAAPRPERQREAVAMVLTGRPTADAALVDAFLDYLRDQRYTLDHLLGRYDDRGGLLAAALGLPAPGGAAMVFLSPVGSRARVPVLAPVVRRLLDQLRGAGATLAQALLEVDQPLERMVLEQAGFTALTRLIYMSHRVDARKAEGLPSVALPGRSVTLTTYTPADEPRFAAAVLASYEGTLDCPGLVGTRPIADVLAGHRAAGVFVPECWVVAEVDGQPAAALLVNALPQRDALELVYLGVGKNWRGLGLGRQLLRLALAWAAQRRAEQVFLAVDEHNAPALSLYRAAGFRREGRRLALVKTLGM